MATHEKEHYWRLFLYLNESVSFLSRGIILRKLDVLGDDISSLLSQNEEKLKNNVNLNATEKDILFPADGKTNIDKWNANLFLCVTLTLFRDSLRPKERTKLGVAQHVLRDLLEVQDETQLDNLTYTEHLENLKVAFDFLSFNEDSKMTIVEIKKMYIEKPLESSNLLKAQEKIHFPSSTKKKFAKFLESISTLNNPSRTDESGHESNPFESTEYSDLYRRTNSVNENTTAVSSGEIDAATDSENASDETDSEDIPAVLQDEIVRGATQHKFAEVRECMARRMDMSNLESSISKQNLEAFAMQEYKNWKEEPVNIAVFGRSGVGKSRFINAIRGGISEDDPLYAPIGQVETTMKAKSYAHPNNPLLKFWDLPGIGTTNFPRQRYFKMKEIGFNSYDIYLILFADRFMEEEATFSRKVEKLGKTFLFIRTKADVNEDDYKDFEAELSTIRKDCVEKLRATKIKSSDIYLISSKIVDHKLLDFGKLADRIISSLDDLKKEVMLNALRFNTITLIKEKKINFENEAMKASVKSAMFGTMPVPGLSFLVDFQIVKRELAEYRKVLCVTDNDIEILAKETGITVDELISKYNLKSFAFFKYEAARGVTQFLSFVPLLKNLALSEAVESAVKFLTCFWLSHRRCTVVLFNIFDVDINVRNHGRRC